MRGYQYICSFGHSPDLLLGQRGKDRSGCRQLQRRMQKEDTGEKYASHNIIYHGAGGIGVYYLGLSYEKVRQICSYQFSEEKGKDLTEKDLDKYFDQHHTVNKSLVEYLAN